MQIVYVLVCTRACVGKGGGEKGDMFILCLLSIIDYRWRPHFPSGIKNFLT